MPIRQNNILRNNGTSYLAGERNRRDTPEWVVVNEWNSTYYSGLDVAFYFDGIYMDEIVQLQYQEMEQAKPLYGYADYVFRKVSRGARIVQGSFSVNFKDSQYILKLLQTIAGENMEVANNTSTGADVAEISAFAEGDATLEDLLAFAQKKSANLSNLKSIWTGSTRPAIINTREGITLANLANLGGVDYTFRGKYTSREGGFDTTIKYGIPANDGHPEGWGTTQVLQGCEITGVQHGIDDSGKNIIESYSFIAKQVIPVDMGT